MMDSTIGNYNGNSLINTNILKNPNIFSLNYKPAKIIDRKKEIDQILELLYNLKTETKIPGILISGMPGSGKTLIINYIKEKIESEISDATFYIRDIYNIEKLKINQNDKKVIFILENIQELPKLKKKDILNILNILAGKTNVTMIFTAESSNPENWKNMLNIPLKEIHLENYSVEELKEILWDRVNEGLIENSIEPEVIDKIAELTFKENSNVNVAIHLLYDAFVYAVTNMHQKITMDDLNNALNDFNFGTFDVYLKLLKDLNPTYQFIIYTLAKNDFLTVSQIYLLSLKYGKTITITDIYYLTFSGFASWVGKKASDINKLKISLVPNAPRDKIIKIIEEKHPEFKSFDVLKKMKKKKT